MSQNNEIYIVNDMIKLNNGKVFNNYITNELDDDCQYKNNYKEINLDLDLLLLKVKDENLSHSFIYNSKEIYIVSKSLIDFLIKKMPFQNIHFSSENLKSNFKNLYSL